VSEGTERTIEFIIEFISWAVANEVSEGTERTIEFIMSYELGVRVMS